MGKYSYYAKSIVEITTGFENWPAVVGIFLRRDGKKTERNERIVRTRSQGLAFKVRGKMDVWSVKEALIDRFYAAENFIPKDGWTIVDIGAGIGEFTLYAAAGMPQSRIFAYEPFPGSFNLLLENIALNGLTNIQTCQKAVWAERGRLLLDTSGGEPLQLVSKAASEHARRPGLIEVDCLSLVDVLSENGLSSVDLLKLDCEGAEYSILLDTPASILARIDRIVMEYHDAAGPHRHEEMVDNLRSHGYQVHIIPNQVHADLGYLFARRS